MALMAILIMLLIVMVGVGAVSSITVSYGGLYCAFHFLLHLLIVDNSIRKGDGACATKEENLISSATFPYLNLMIQAFGRCRNSGVLLLSFS